MVMEHLSERAWTGLRAQDTQLDIEDQKTLALMSRVVDMGLETADIATGPAHTVRLVRLWPHQLSVPKWACLICGRV